MIVTSALPRFAKDIISLNLIDRIKFNVVILWYRITGYWKYPVKTSGDLETMTTKDKIYWIYKSANPIFNASKNSGLETFFERQLASAIELPINFRVYHEIKLTAVGDLMPHAFLKNSKHSLYSEIHESIFGSDIAMANLECCISANRIDQLQGNTKKAPILHFDPYIFDVVKGFEGRRYDFVSTACNHSLDLGIEGILSTIQKLKTEHIQFHGINLNKDNLKNAEIIDKKAIKVGLICFTFGLNGAKPPADKPWIVNKLNLNAPVHEINFAQLEKQIQYCRLNEVDFIIAQLHWGYEFEYYPRPDQVVVAHHLAEIGIDLIIGHHPHVVQPVEYYRTLRDKDRIVPIYYSLGNLINPFSAPFMCTSCLAQITLAKGLTEKGMFKTYIKKAETSKIFQTYCKETGTVKLTKDLKLGEKTTRINRVV